jgi:hypothetical protein
MSLNETYNTETQTELKINGTHRILAYAENVNLLGCDKQTPWPFVRKRTIPTERLPLVDEI